MLTHLQDLGARLGDFAMPELSMRETDNALTILSAFYGGSDPALLVPRSDEAAIRAALERDAPQLAANARALRKALESDYSAILIRRMRLEHLAPEQRAFILFGLSLCMGTPTPTDQVQKRIVWDVKASAARMQAGDVSTFSEHAYEAELHTDTQYYAHPERYVLLYFVHSAACGGGVSRLRDVSCIRRQLARSERGRWALEFLSRQQLPFRIPATFTGNGRRDAVELTYATIFSDTPAIRFRIDTLEAGLAARPEYATPDVRSALAILYAELERPEFVYEELLGEDSVLMVNNHEVLHGRTQFTDMARHALRIRIADTLAPLPVARPALTDEACAA
jgi:alpha-ketoglutarate-dependent taurine dioxygenase